MTTHSSASTTRRGDAPAIAAGPFVTTGIDLLAILIYVSTAKLILGL